jgi:hypothetical protein
VPLRGAVPLSLEHLVVTPPELLTLREEDDASVFIVEYRLAPVPGGTELTHISRIDWKKLPRGLHWLFARGVRRDMRLQLGDLRRLLEKGPGVS